MPRQTVLLAGATATDDVALKLLVRQPTLDDTKREALDSLVERGVEIRVRDVSDPASLDAATRGVDVVVSALQGGPDVVVDGEVALARAAVAKGVKRIIPSDFALDHVKAIPGEHMAFDWRPEADKQIAALDIEQVNVFNGAFPDGAATPGAAVIFDDEAGTATYWGFDDEHFEAADHEESPAHGLAGLGRRRPAST